MTQRKSDSESYWDARKGGTPDASDPESMRGFRDAQNDNMEGRKKLAESSKSLEGLSGSAAAGEALGEAIAPVVIWSATWLGRSAIWSFYMFGAAILVLTLGKLLGLGDTSGSVTEFDKSLPFEFVLFGIIGTAVLFFIINRKSPKLLLRLVIGIYVIGGLTLFI